MTFIRQVCANAFSFSTGLVTGLKLLPGTGATKRPQEILYMGMDSKNKKPTLGTITCR
jgi:hypothetical protein